jgi:nitroreductase
MDPWKISADDFPADGEPVEQMRFLVAYAVLAASSNNTQSWRFSVGPRHVDIFADLERWLPVTDPGQREVYINVGCALENLLIAAEHFGFSHQVSWFPDGDDQARVARVDLRAGGQPEPWRPAALFEMLTVRHTNHSPFEDRAIPTDELARLEACCVEKEVVLRLHADRSFRRSLNDMVVRGDLVQFADSKFRKELAYWISQGSFATPWLTSKLLGLIVRQVDIGRSQAQRDSELILSSPALGVLATRTDDRLSQVKTGQVFQRLGLRAAAAGLHTHPMSQPVEVAELRDELTRLLSPPVLFPQHPFRLGYAEPHARRTTRRPLDEVVVLA